MESLKSKEDAKKYAKLLKNFYGELYTYILANAAIILFWLFSGSGHFWPIYVILIWGAFLVIKASKLHIIDHKLYQECDQLRERFLFLKKDWEERKVEQLVQRAREKGLLKEETASKVKAEKIEEKPKAPKASASSKKTASTTSAKKPASAKKTAPKKKSATK